MKMLVKLLSSLIHAWKVEVLQETRSMEIASCLHGFVEEHSTHNLAIVHVVAELRIGFAVVD